MAESSNLQMTSDEESIRPELHEFDEARKYIVRTRVFKQRLDGTILWIYLNGRIHMFVPDAAQRKEMRTARKAAAYYGRGSHAGFRSTPTKGWFFVFDDGSATPYMFQDFRQGFDHEIAWNRDDTEAVLIVYDPALNHFEMPVSVKKGIPRSY